MQPKFRVKLQKKNIWGDTNRLQSSPQDDNTSVLGY